ncbi:MAG: NADH dehydrogenase [Chloroflexi bacterium RBG_13_46_9]|nr:MAG: NADH dehydrogenase [Chloroflexi bacterium RBG_13_46_9]
MNGKIGDKQVEDILASHGKSTDNLVPMLLDIQDSFGYLPENVIQRIAEFLSVTLGQIYSVATFYKRFQLTPVGRQRITICRGTACHIRGAPQIINEIEQTIGIKEGETSEDMEYTLETVACIGCCALAPCLKINESVHGAMTPRKAGTLFTTSGGKNAR